MRLFQFIFTILWGLGYLGNGFLFLYVEWSFLRQSFVQVFNPFLHLQVFGVLLTIPLFWMFLAMSVVGYYAASKIERYLWHVARRAETNDEKVYPSPQAFQERHPSPLLPSGQDEHEQPYSPLSPRPFPKPTSDVAPAKNMDVQFKQRPYIKYRTDEIARIAASEWNNVKVLSEIH